VNYRIGLRRPAHCTATGKAILSELPDQRVRELFGNEPLPRPTRHSLGSLDELLRELEATRLRGYSLDDEETVEGMCCVGAAVRSRSDVRAGVAFSTVKARLTPERVDQLARQVVELARRLSQRLGAYP
jgi:DNA-binding IclR family transcriptional regulator